jgi:hypothetical protein
MTVDKIAWQYKLPFASASFKDPENNILWDRLQFNDSEKELNFNCIKAVSAFLLLSSCVAFAKRESMPTDHPLYPIREFLSLESPCIITGIGKHTLDTRYISEQAISRFSPHFSVLTSPCKRNGVV